MSLFFLSYTWDGWKPAETESRALRRTEASKLGAVSTSLTENVPKCSDHSALAGGSGAPQDVLGDEA